MTAPGRRRTRHGIDKGEDADQLTRLTPSALIVINDYQSAATTLATEQRFHMEGDSVPDLSTKDKIIAYLMGVMEGACEDMAAYLSDNTEEVFEEIPEIDGARGDLYDAMDAVNKALPQVG